MVILQYLAQMTPSFGNQYSIQLSYGRVLVKARSITVFGRTVHATACRKDAIVPLPMIDTQSAP